MIRIKEKDDEREMKMIELHENGLDIQFRIRENGVVELADFSSQEVKKAPMEPKEDIFA